MTYFFKSVNGLTPLGDGNYFQVRRDSDSASVNGLTPLGDGNLVIIYDFRFDVSIVLMALPH